MKQFGVFRLIGLGIGVAIVTMAMSCGGGIEGTYGDPNGATKLELKSGGKATFTLMNQPAECTYTVDKKKVTLDCKDGARTEFTLSDDNTTLINPPGSVMPNMKKSK